MFSNQKYITMIKNYKKQIGIVHLINGLSALITGWILMKNPSGEIFNLPLEWVADTPMRNYAVIGLIWFVFNGLVGLLFAAISFTKNKFYADLAIIQGGLLASWLLLAIVIVKQMIWMWQLPYFVLAVALIVLGVKALNQERK